MSHLTTSAAPVAADVEPVARQWIEGVVLGSPVARRLGVEAVTVTVDRAVLRLPYDDVSDPAHDTVHGGVLSTLVDIAGAASSATGVAAGDGATGGVTTHLSVAFLAPATGDLTADATVVHRTRSTTLSEVAVHDRDGRLVARGQVSSRIFH